MRSSWKPALASIWVVLACGKQQIRRGQIVQILAVDGICDGDEVPGRDDRVNDRIFEEAEDGKLGAGWVVEKGEEGG